MFLFVFSEISWLWQKILVARWPEMSTVLQVWYCHNYVERYHYLCDMMSLYICSKLGIFDDMAYYKIWSNLLSTITSKPLLGSLLSWIPALIKYKRLKWFSQVILGFTMCSYLINLGCSLSFLCIQRFLQFVSKYSLQISSMHMFRPFSSWITFYGQDCRKCVLKVRFQIPYLDLNKWPDFQNCVKNYTFQKYWAPSSSNFSPLCSTSTDRPRTGS